MYGRVAGLARGTWHGARHILLPRSGTPCCAPQDVPMTTPVSWLPCGASSRSSVRAGTRPARNSTAWGGANQTTQVR